MDLLVAQESGGVAKNEDGVIARDRTGLSQILPTHTNPPTEKIFNIFIDII